MSTLDETFAEFFGAWSEEKAADMQEYWRGILAEADSAIANNDIATLKRLGLTYDGYPTYEGQDYFDFPALIDTAHIEEMRSDVSLTPVQLAAKMNR